MKDNSNINVTCVCSRCSHHEDKNVIIEINFYEKMIYWVCPSCNFTNKMEIAKPSAKLPKMRVIPP